MLNRLLSWLLAASLVFLPLQAQAVDDLWNYDATTPANNTNVGGVSFAEGQLPGLWNDGARALISQLKRAVANQGSDIASASSTAICATGTSAYVKVTGTTTITSFGTAAAGCSRWVTFTGALQITHNATSMILPGAANFTTSAGDMIWAVSEGSGNWRVRIFPASGKTVVPNSNGVHKLGIPAQGISGYPGAPPGYAETLGTDFPRATWDFDQTTLEASYFQILMPSSWDEGTITFVVDWTAASGSGDVTFGLQCRAVSNDDALAGSALTAIKVTDTLIATGDLHRTPQSAAVTVDNSPAANDFVMCILARFPADGTDSLNADARVLGIELFLTTDAATDTP